MTTKSSPARRPTTVNFDDGIRESLASIPLSNLREAERAKKQKDDERALEHCDAPCWGRRAGHYNPRKCVTGAMGCVTNL